MKISDLKPGAFQLLTAQVDEVDTPREFVRKDGTKGLRQTVMLKDQTGRIPLVLWDEDAEVILKKGQLVEIQYGFCTTFKDQPQIGRGRFGIIKYGQD